MTVGAMLRDWREDRRRSQMDLAIDVGVSTRHLSFVETGKSKPSPELVLALAEHLDVPLRERNSMLLAAGYAPRYPQTSLDDASMTAVREALGGLIRAHDPYPAVVVDRAWDVVMTNTGAQGFLDGVADHLLQGPLNSYRITLHPDGMAPRIVNFAEWAHDLLGTLDRQVAATHDPRLPRPARRRSRATRTSPPSDRRGGHAASTPTIVVPLQLRVGTGEAAYTQSWFSTNTSIGTPVDITLDELHVELFHPADEATAAMVGGRTA